jgi:hypothetical protein
VNRIYRLVWSERQGAFVPAAETARRRGKRSGGGAAIVGGLVASALSAAAMASGAMPPVTLTNAPRVILGHADDIATGNQHKAATAGSTRTPPAAHSALLPTALPTAPQVVLGQASVSTTGNQMDVTETTSSAAIDWGSFNIGSSAGVTCLNLYREDSLLVSAAVAHKIGSNPNPGLDGADADGRDDSTRFWLQVVKYW